MSNYCYYLYSDIKSIVRFEVLVPREFELS